MKLYLTNDQIEQLGTHRRPKLEEIREVFTRTEHEPSIAFSNVFRTENGYMARHVQNNQPDRTSFQVHVSHDFRCEITIPLSVFMQTETRLLSSVLPNYHHIDRFCLIAEHQQYGSAKIIDLNSLFYAFMGIAGKLLELARKFDVKTSFHNSGRVSGAVGATPFVDSTEILDDFEEFGLPFINKNNIYFSDTPDVFREIEIEGNDGTAQRLNFALRMMMRCAPAFGISFSDDPEKRQSK